MNESFGTTARLLALYRLARNLLDTQRSNRLVSLLYRLLVYSIGGKAGYKSVKSQLKRIRSIEKKIAAHQMGRWPVLHRRRGKIGKRYRDRLVAAGIMSNRGFRVDDSSFAKFFVYHPAIKARKLVGILNNQGIEVMHLEQKYGSPVQERLAPEEKCAEKRLRNYNNAHDHLISLPLFE